LRRITISVREENWMKYRRLKAQMLKDYSEEPELNFTEFANLCMKLSCPTAEDVIKNRKQKRKCENA